MRTHGHYAAADSAIEASRFLLRPFFNEFVVAVRASSVLLARLASEKESTAESRSRTTRVVNDFWFA